MRIRRAVTNLPVLSSAEAGPGRVTCPARAKAFTLTSGFWLDIVLFLFQHGAPSCLTHVLLNGTTPLVRGHRAPIAADTNATSSSSWNPIRRHTRSASRVSEARPQCVRPTPDPDASGTVYDSTFHTVIWRFFPSAPRAARLHGCHGFEREIAALVDAMRHRRPAHAGRTSARLRLRPGRVVS